MSAIDGFQALHRIRHLSARQQYALGCCVVGSFAHSPAVLTALLNAGLLDVSPQGELFAAPYTVPPAVAHAYRVWARDRLAA